MKLHTKASLSTVNLHRFLSKLHLPMSHNSKFTTRLLLRSKSKVRNHTRIDSDLSFNYICPYDPRETF